MKVAIAGYGVEGKASYEYWNALGADITIYDEKKPEQEMPEGAKSYFAPDAFTKIDDADLVVRTAGLNPNKISTTSKVWSATNEFFEKCPAPIIGVTGTKGKGTTCTLIYEILKAAGKTVHLVGNIGIAALDVLPSIKPEDIIVFELSSFQLWDIERSPQTAVVLMIEPDHMDVHASMTEYITAKANIARFQNEADTLIYHPSNDYSAQIAAISKAQKKTYMSEEGADIKNEAVVIEGHKICSTKEIGLIGSHNLENICAAVTAAWEYTQEISAFEKAIKNFTGLPHRLEFVREVNGVKFYNDSQATGVASTLAALRTFSEPTTLVFGGSDKGIDVTEVVNELHNDDFVILIGQSSQKIEQLLIEREFKNYINLGTNTSMSNIVKIAASKTSEGGVVLLSPAHASFDMFINYQDRGDQFKNAVATLV